jgi:hypothetical protein
MVTWSDYNASHQTLFIQFINNSEVWEQLGYNTSTTPGQDHEHVQKLETMSHVGCGKISEIAKICHEPLYLQHI